MHKPALADDMKQNGVLVPSQPVQCCGWPVLLRLIIPVLVRTAPPACMGTKRCPSIRAHILMRHSHLGTCTPDSRGSVEFSFLRLTCMLYCRTMDLYGEPPVGEDIYADQRGRIIGSCVAIFVITDIFVLLRFVSRKLARAGYWVRNLV